MHRFERLVVWKRAHRLAVAMLRDRSLGGNAAGRDVGSQLRRATLSISANIAEGAGSATPALFARYLGVAIASAHEASALLLTAADAGLIDRSVVASHLAEVREMRAMLFALRRRIVHSARARSVTAVLADPSS